MKTAIIRVSTLILVILTGIFLNSCNTDQMNEFDINPNVSEKISAPANIIPGDYIVVYKSNAITDANQKQKKNHASNTALVRKAINEHLKTKNISAEGIKRVYSSVFDGFSATLSKEAVKALQEDENVAYVEPDQLISLVIPEAGKGKKPPKDGGGSNSPPQETPFGITRVGGSSDATGKTAWIIDTGIDFDHPDLNVDIIRARTFVLTGKDSRNADDGHGHGTHVAGIIGAKDNTIGVIGVAANALVVPVKVLNSRGSGTYSGVIAGIDYVSNAGIAGDVANLSLGGPISQAVDDAVVNAASKGIYFAIAAGNNSGDANNYSPARVNDLNIYTISAMDAMDVFASFSNYNNPPIDYCAPGVAIYSTWKGGSYRTLSGTSMASPHAAGILLVTNGQPSTDGFVTGDSDNYPDPIIVK